MYVSTHSWANFSLNESPFLHIWSQTFDSTWRRIILLISWLYFYSQAKTYLNFKKFVEIQFMMYLTRIEYVWTPVWDGAQAYTTLGFCKILGQIDTKYFWLQFKSILIKFSWNFEHATWISNIHGFLIGLHVKHQLLT